MVRVCPQVAAGHCRTLQFGFDGPRESEVLKTTGIFLCVRVYLDTRKLYVVVLIDRACNAELRIDTDTSVATLGERKM